MKTPHRKSGISSFQITCKQSCDEPSPAAGTRVRNTFCFVLVTIINPPLVLNQYFVQSLRTILVSVIN